jgi:hypothetical protein
VRIDATDRMKAAVFCRWWSGEHRRLLAEDALAARFAGGASMRAVWNELSKQFPAHNLFARLLGWLHFRRSR